jgi:hypothetical protein
MVGAIQGWLAVTDVEFSSLAYWDRMVRLAELQPPFAIWVSNDNMVWVGSEMIVMLFNRQRRALHDFIAGTLVVKTR